MEYTIEAMDRMIDGMSTATKFGFIEAVIEVLPIYDTYRMITRLKREYYNMQHADGGIFRRKQHVMKDDEQEMAFRYATIAFHYFTFDEILSMMRTAINNMKIPGNMNDSAYSGASILSEIICAYNDNLQAYYIKQGNLE